MSIDWLMSLAGLITNICMNSIKICTKLCCSCFAINVFVMKKRSLDKTRKVCRLPSELLCMTSFMMECSRRPEGFNSCSHSTELSHTNNRRQFDANLKLSLTKPHRRVSRWTLNPQKFMNILPKKATRTRNMFESDIRMHVDSAHEIFESWKKRFSGTSAKIR